MSRPITGPILSSMMAQESADGYVILLEVSHPIMPEPIRVASHQNDFQSQGWLWLACPFRIDGPPDVDEAPPSVTLTIDNIDRRMVEAVRSIPHGEGPVIVLMSVVTTTYPDTVEYGPFGFSMREARYNRMVVVGGVGFEDVLREPASWARFTPNDHPGMF